MNTTNKTVSCKPNNKTLSGLISYVVTPFSSNGTVNLDMLGQLLDQLIDAGSDGIGLLGSVGECAYLDQDEKKCITKYTLNYVKNRVPIIVGISDLTTQLAVENAVYAYESGADALMLTPFSYFPLSETEIYAHIETISSHVAIPIMLYNNPVTSGVDMTPEFIHKVVQEIDNVLMVKESSGSVSRLQQLLQINKHTRVKVFNGNNKIAYEALLAGVDGWCTAVPCLIGTLPKQLIKSINIGELETARQGFSRLSALLSFMVENGLVPTVKTGLKYLGIDAGLPRKPLQNLCNKNKQVLEHLLSQHKLLADSFENTINMSELEVDNEYKKL